MAEYVVSLSRVFQVPVRFSAWPVLQGSTAQQAWGYGSQLHLPSVMPLSEAGCGRLQLEAATLGYHNSITAST